MRDILQRLGVQETSSGACAGEWLSASGDSVDSINPSTGEVLGSVISATGDEYEKVVAKSMEVFPCWRMEPAPKRGEIVRLMGEELRAHKEDLGKLISLEMGKIQAEGEGEVQEMIDIADFSVGLSRQLYGLTMHSERPQHRMYEQWHPLGVVGIISAFNFPTAVWSWNAMIAAVCGNTMIWKPSEKTPLTAIAVQNICNRVLDRHGWSGVMNLCFGDVKDVGHKMIHDTRLPLISATGSCRMGKEVGAAVAARMGKSLLELGGNNAIIVLDDADIELALRGVLFGSVGTAGQRCTTTRRLLVQKGIAGKLTERLVKAYGQVTIGDPLDSKTLMGPLIDEGAVDMMMRAIDEAKAQGGEVLCGGKRLSDGDRAKGFFVEPTLIKGHAGMNIIQEETFAPILYIIEVDNLEEALGIHNGVKQGLSSSIFTDSVRSAEKFLSHAGSDCGIANVNIGTSGAEIGGAFGGEKETGGGRESGSDSWKAYMRRQTNTINWGDDLPLAQGIQFGS